MPRTVRKGLGRYRLAQLRSDLKLSPEARVLEAEESYREFQIIRAAHPEIPEYPPAPTPRSPRRVAERPIPVPSDQYSTRIALVCSVLNAERARYCIVGARALQLWGSARSTTDVDILVEPTSANIQRVLRGLSRLGFGLAADYTADEILANHVTIIGDTPRVDVLTRAWNLRWPDAEPRLVAFTVEGVSVPAVSIEDLIVSKQTGRPQDAADIEVLEAIMNARSKTTR
jgi:hypothetical protein